MRNPDWSPGLKRWSPHSHLQTWVSNTAVYNVLTLCMDNVVVVVSLHIDQSMPYFCFSLQGSGKRQQTVLMVKFQHRPQSTLGVDHAWIIIELISAGWGLTSPHAWKRRKHVIHNGFLYIIILFCNRGVYQQILRILFSVIKGFLANKVRTQLDFVRRKPDGAGGVIGIHIVCVSDHWFLGAQQLNLVLWKFGMGGLCVCVVCDRVDCEFFYVVLLFVCFDVF